MLENDFVGVFSSKGKVRSKNDDAYFVHFQERVFAVADGMGPEGEAKKAIKVIFDELESCLKEKYPLQSILHICNNSVYTEYNKQSKLLERGTKPIGSTLVLAKIHNTFVELVWAGDTRAYMLQSHKSLKQITYDHTYAYELFRLGQISYQEIASHPKAHTLTSAIGLHEKSSEIIISKLKAAWEKGDILFLCTDGLYNQVGEEEIQKQLQRKDIGLQEQAETLVKLAEDAGGPDNITVMLVDVAKAHLEQEAGFQTLELFNQV